jgi:hypothetical protein
VGLGGWHLIELADAITETGEPCSWSRYQHPDGRQALVSSEGQATDPELQALLSAQVMAAPPVHELPWWAQLALRRWPRRSQHQGHA